MLLNMCVLAVVFCVSHQLSAQVEGGVHTPLQKTRTTNALSVSAPTQEWLGSYLEWTHHHPGVIKRDASGSPVSLVLEMPYLELFSPSGVRLYHGKTSEGNAAFIDSIQSQLPHLTAVADSDSRPTLQEYLGMFSELQPYKDQIMQHPMYTLFSVSYSDSSMCKAQVDAIRRIAPSASLRIIEIWLVRH